MDNNTTFAISYMRASQYLMDAVASFNPSTKFGTALHCAQRAEIAAGNTIEETLAGNLIRSIESARSSCMAGADAFGIVKSKMV